MKRTSLPLALSVAAVLIAAAAFVRSGNCLQALPAASLPAESPPAAVAPAVTADPGPGLPGRRYGSGEEFLTETLRRARAQHPERYAR